MIESAEKPNNIEIEHLPNEVAFIVITRYPAWYPGKLSNKGDTDKVRGDIALETAQTAKNLGYNIIVASSDDSSKSFNEALSATGAKVVAREQPDRTSAFVTAIKEALKLEGVDAIIMMQAEKTSLLDSGLDITRPILDKKADVVVPKRDQALFTSSYPDYMLKMEMDDNAYVNRVLRMAGWRTPEQEDLDIFFGVIALRNDPEMIKTILALYEYTGKSGNSENSGAQRHIRDEETFHPIYAALANRYEVASVTVPFVYPADQKQNEEDPETIKGFIKKRQNQRRGLILEAVHFVRQGFGQNQAKLKITTKQPSFQ